MTDAAPHAETPPAALSQPRALWPWVLGTVVLLLGTLAFSFWWPMHRAGKLISRIEGGTGNRVGVEFSHPEWIEWLFGEKVFHPWFDRVVWIVANDDIVDDWFLSELAQFSDLHSVQLNVSNASGAAIVELNHLSSIQSCEIIVNGSMRSLDWVAEISLPLRLSILNRGLSIEDWESLASCESLQSLSLVFCDVGDIPEIHLPERMSEIRFHKCQLLSGSLGRTLSQLRHLERVWCVACPTEEAFWYKLGDSTASFELSLIGMPLTDAALTEIAGIRSVSKLELVYRDTKIDGDQIDKLCRLDLLTQIEIIRSVLPDDHSWDALGELTRLHHLDLSESTIGDRTAAALAEIPNLESLDLSGTALSEVGLVALEKNRTLKHLWLSETALTPNQIDASRLRRPDWEITAHNLKPSGSAIEAEVGVAPHP